MELGEKIKKLRKDNGFSQDKLAELLLVSRQTISNWENDKSYPDIHNIILLSDVFSTSLDNLLKGDIDIMKKELANSTTIKSNVKEVMNLTFSGIGIIVGLLLFIFGLALLPRYRDFISLAISVFGAIVMFISAFYAEKFKKKNKLKTYKEVSGFYDYSLNLLENKKQD